MSFFFFFSSLKLPLYRKGHHMYVVVSKKIIVVWPLGRIKYWRWSISDAHLHQLNTMRVAGLTVYLNGFIYNQWFQTLISAFQFLSLLLCTFYVTSLLDGTICINQTNDSLQHTLLTMCSGQVYDEPLNLSLQSALSLTLLAGCINHQEAGSRSKKRAYINSWDLINYACNKKSSFLANSDACIVNWLETLHLDISSKSSWAGRLTCKKRLANERWWRENHTPLLAKRYVLDPTRTHAWGVGGGWQVRQFCWLFKPTKSF